MNTTINFTEYSQIDNFDDLRAYHDRMRASNEYQNSNSFFDIVIDGAINIGRVVTGREPLLDPTPPQHSQSIELAQNGVVAAVTAAAVRYGARTVGTVGGAVIATPEVIHAVINSAGGGHATQYANALDVLDAAARGEISVTQDAYNELARSLARGTFGDKVAMVEQQLQNAASQSGVRSTTLDAVPDGGDTKCFLGDTPIQMWPLDPMIKPRADGSYDEAFVLSKVWEKPISEIKVGDIVVAYDDKGRLGHKRVLRTMENRATHILDFWGTGTTPGHAYHCADGPNKGGHAPIMDILRMDGAIMRADGTMIRAATNCKVGSMGDMMIHASATLQKPDGSWTEPKAGKVRFGTRIILPDGCHISLVEMAAREGWKVTDDGYMVGMMRNEAGELQEQKFHFPYGYGEELPKPEDYILARSKVSLEAIYAAGEWEQIGTRMPAPAGMIDLNTNHTGTLLQPTKPEPNIPPAFADHPDAPKDRRQKVLQRI